MSYVVNFRCVDKTSLHLVGGKNASLGEMIKAGIRVPPGFAVTTESYLAFIKETGIHDKIHDILAGFDPEDIASLDRSPFSGVNCEVVRTKESMSEIIPFLKRGVNLILYFLIYIHRFLHDAY